jgi:2-oxoglutarate ferredoxin oxidoreductase subunit alpha
MVDVDLDPGADILVVAYGVTAGAMKRAVRLARERGRSVSSLVVQSVWPVPETALAEALVGIERVIVPELNPGLYRREIERIAGSRDVVGLERIDGELITADQIMEVIG